MKTARDLVSLSAELASGVQLGHHYLESRLVVLRHHLHRDAASVVHDFDRTVFADGHVDARTETREGLVYGIVHNLIDQVV